MIIITYETHKHQIKTGKNLLIMEQFLYQRLTNKTPKINIWFAYPAIESFAMASLGYLNIFKMLDLNENLFVERVYSDSISTQANAEDVSAIGFSVSFEMDILTIIKMLKKYNIPLKAKERNENYPLIFAGGPVLMSNPLPYEEMFDFISIGEKTALNGAMDILIEKEEKSLNREEVLEKLSNQEGIYVPKYKKEVKITRDNLDTDIAYTPVLSEKSFFKDTFIVEIERGCPKMCNFCLASWLNLPVRFVPYEKIIEVIDLGLEYTNKIALLGAYVAGHPDFSKIISYISKKCEENPIELSISSLRADLADIDLIKTLVKCNQKTATIALEAGSQRLRDLIQKDLTKKQVLNTIKTAYLGGLKGLKIYTMIGLPTETDEDIEELVELVKEMKNLIKKTSKEHSLGGFDITISSSTFIPKAQTPFEFVERADKRTLEKRISYLKKSFHQLGVTYRSSSIEWDIIQSILSRYNESLVDLLIKVVEEGGNLGAFKKVWRKEAKIGNLPDFDECSIKPFNNIKTQKTKWGFIITDNGTLKKNRQNQLETYLKS